MNNARKKWSSGTHNRIVHSRSNLPICGFESAWPLRRSKNKNDRPQDGPITRRYSHSAVLSTLQTTTCVQHNQKAHLSPPCPHGGSWLHLQRGAEARCVQSLCLQPAAPQQQPRWKTRHWPAGQGQAGVRAAVSGFVSTSSGRGPANTTQLHTRRLYIQQAQVRAALDLG